MTHEAIPLEIGEWLPDLPALNNPGCLQARNTIPHGQSYCDLKSLSAFTSALTSACLGALWFQGSDNTVYNFAGDTGKLYRLDSGITWTDVSKVGGYSVTNWDMAKFGDRVIAVADGQAPQYFDAGVSSAFADLPGSPPVAARVGIVRDFVMLGDLETLGPNYVAWSGFNSSELWTPSRTTQSDQQALFGRGGRVQRIVPGEYATVFQEQSIWRGDYVGPPLIFQFDEVERGRGTPAANSVCWTGQQIYYLGHDGFYVFDGAQSAPIGIDRVNRWFFSEIDTQSFDSVRGVVDRQNRLVLWAFRTSSSLTYNDRLLIYNWGSNRWAYAEVDTEVLAEFVSSGFSLDQLDTPLPAGIDIDSIPVDTDAFKGGVLGLQAFDTSHQSATFSGTPLTARFVLAEYGAPDGRMLYMSAQRPLVEGTGATVPKIGYQIRAEDQLWDNSQLQAPEVVDDNGLTYHRTKARYVQFVLDLEGGFSNAVGVEVFGHQRAGRRGRASAAI